MQAITMRKNLISTLGLETGKIVKNKYSKAMENEQRQVEI